MTRIALLSTSDTDLLSARACGADYLWANPSKAAHTDLAAALEACDLIVVRLLGSPRDLCSGFLRFRPAGKPMVVVGGEQTPDAALMEQSTVPIGVAADAHVYLAQGGPANLAQLHAFLSDTVLLTGVGFEPPAEQPTWGVLPTARGRAIRRALTCRGAVARDQQLGLRQARARDRAAGRASSSTAPSRPPGTPRTWRRWLARSTRPAGWGCRSSPPRCAMRRPTCIEYLGTLDALITTVLAAGGTRPATASAGEDDEGWDVRALAALDIPILQGLCLTSPREAWAASDEGMSPLDVATQVAVPEFDGRLITVPFSFKETDADGLPHYVPDTERCRRVAEIAVNHARLRHIPPAERRIALVLSAYPTKHSRIGNAVGLDTPVSLIRLLRAMRAPGLRPRRAG